MTSKETIDANIEQLVERAARELLLRRPELRAANQQARSDAMSEALEDRESSAAKLQTAIKGDPSFDLVRDGWLRGGNYGMRAQGHMLPHILIGGAIDGQSAKGMVAAARELAGERTCVVEWYTPLAGVSVAKSVSLDGNFDLVPWADIPESAQKTRFGPLQQPSEFAFTTSGTPYLQVTANSALRQRSEVIRVLFSAHDEAQRMTDGIHERAKAVTMQAQDAVRCITALNASVVVPVGNWAQFDNWIANKLLGAGYSYQGPQFEHAVHLASRSPATLKGTALADLIRKFQHFEESDKGAIRIVLDRLGQALRRPTLVDKAIDLGIALEVMLLHEVGGDRGELKYRSSARGAAFLGGKNQKRVETFKLLKSAYDLRSLAVHTGVLKSKHKGTSTKQVLNDATDACADIAQKLIGLGKFPDWDDQYVIGGAN